MVLGVELFALLVVRPAANQMPSDVLRQAMGSIHKAADRGMPPLVSAGLVVGLATTIGAAVDGHGERAVLAGAGLLLLACWQAVIVASVLPGNRRMSAAVAPEAELPDVRQIQQRWNATTPFRVLILAPAAGLALAAALV